MFAFGSSAGVTWENLAKDTHTHVLGETGRVIQRKQGNHRKEAANCSERGNEAGEIQVGRQTIRKTFRWWESAHEKHQRLHHQSVNWDSPEAWLLQPLTQQHVGAVGGWEMQEPAEVERDCLAYTVVHPGSLLWNVLFLALDGAGDYRQLSLKEQATRSHFMLIIDDLSKKM